MQGLRDKTRSVPRGSLLRAVNEEIAASEARSRAHFKWFSPELPHVVRFDCVDRRTMVGEFRVAWVLIDIEVEEGGRSHPANLEKYLMQRPPPLRLQGDCRSNIIVVRHRDGDRALRIDVRTGWNPADLEGLECVEEVACEGRVFE